MASAAAAAPTTDPRVGSDGRSRGRAGSGRSRAPLVEQAAPPDGLKLAVVADQHEPPLLQFGEGDELVEGVGADHPGLVDDDRRPGRKVVGGEWWPVVAVPLVDQFGDGVCAQPDVTLHDAGRFRRRRHPEHDPAIPLQVVDGGLQHAGLAGTGRADHQHQPVLSGDGGRGVGLQHVQPRHVDGGRRCRVGGLGVERPRHDVFFLGEHGVAGEVWRDRVQPHRAAI